jgi:hypothetical protein
VALISQLAFVAITVFSILMIGGILPGSSLSISASIVGAVIASVMSYLASKADQQSLRLSKQAQEVSFLTNYYDSQSKKWTDELAIASYIKNCIIEPTQTGFQKLSSISKIPEAKLLTLRNLLHPSNCALLPKDKALTLLCRYRIVYWQLQQDLASVSTWLRTISQLTSQESTVGNENLIWAHQRDQDAGQAGLRCHQLLETDLLPHFLESLLMAKIFSEPTTSLDFMCYPKPPETRAGLLLSGQQELQPYVHFYFKEKDPSSPVLTLTYAETKELYKAFHPIPSLLGS